MRQIANAELTPADIPPPSASWDEIQPFALSFNGYERWGGSQACAEIANAMRHGSLDELRTCLFFEQRRWRHFGETPDDASMAYIGSVLEKIRRIIEEGGLR